MHHSDPAVDALLQLPLHCSSLQAQLDRLEALLLKATGGQAPVASTAAQSAGNGDSAAASSSRAAAQD